MFYKLISLCLLVTIYYSTAQEERIEANWSPCTYENGSVIETKARNISVFVSNCTRNETECRFTRGTSAQLDITFTSLAASPEIERGILAKMYMSALGKYVRIPYGNTINPCHNMRSLNETIDTDNHILNNCVSTDTQDTTATSNCMSAATQNTTHVPNCLSTGIKANQTYNSLSEFEVSTDFPEVSGIQVMVLFRHKVANRRVSSLRKWDKHPGPMFLCIVLDNCAVV